MSVYLCFYLFIHGTFGDIPYTFILKITQQPFPQSCERTIASDIRGRFYIRLNVKDQLGIIRIVGEVCEKHGVSIDSIQQTPVTDLTDIPFVVTTDKATYSKVQKICDELATHSWCNRQPFIMPIY